MILTKYFKNCCKNTTLYKKAINLMFFALISSFFLNSCGLVGGKKEEVKKKEEEITKEKDWEANVLKRVDQNKGGIILFGKSKNQASVVDNVIWQASLQTLQDIPLAQANYAGGIIITDWYSPTSSNESVKISLFIYSDKAETNSFDVKSFKKKCQTSESCTTTPLGSEFNQSIKEKVLVKARSIALNKKKSE